ncbi:MAG: efflux RND transporter periplasmic adaptor subunit [Chloroflexi bacterium]|nr:efflux RND transporter periplasmic adaptor subunit [Chloroflexota bacterium]
MRNRIRPLILLLALVGLLAFGYWRVRQDAAAAEGPVEAAGSIEATQIDVAPELGGRVLEVLAVEGDAVEAGQTLVRLDSSLLEAQRRQAEANRDLARVAALDAVASTGPAARLSAAQLAQAEASLALVEAQLERMTVTAPSAGTILERAVEPGEIAVPGAPLMRLGLLDRLWITVYVPEDRYGQIEVGDRATLTVDAYPDRSFEAVVRAIADQAEFTPRNVQTASSRRATVYAVSLAISDSRGRLKPGMPADLRFDE